MPILDLELPDGSAFSVEFQNEPSDADIRLAIKDYQSQPELAEPTPANQFLSQQTPFRGGGLSFTDQPEPPGFTLPSVGPTETTIEPTGLLGEQARKLPNLQATTAGGPRLQLPDANVAVQSAIGELGQAAGEVLTHPSPIPTPFPEIAKDENPFVAAGKEAVNLAVGVPQFFTTAPGIGAAAGAPVAPGLVSGLFTADLLKTLGKQIKDTYGNWSSMSPAQKAIAVTDMVGTGVFATLTGKHAGESAMKFAEQNVPRGTGISSEPTIGETYARSQQEAATGNGNRGTPPIGTVPTEPGVVEDVPPATARLRVNEGEGVAQPRAPADVGGAEPTAETQAQAPEVAPEPITPEAIADQTGFTYDAGMVPGRWHFTDRQIDSPTRELSVTVPEGATPEQVFQAFDAKLKLGHKPEPRPTPSDYTGEPGEVAVTGEELQQPKPAPTEPVKRQPLNMAGQVRQKRAPFAGPPAFETLHPKSQEKFNAAWEAKDGPAMVQLLGINNKGLRGEFAKRTGIKLPNTQGGTKATVESWAKGAFDKPAREIITPANDTIIGKNDAGETLYQRADGSIYRMANGRPNFGGDLAQVEPKPPTPTPPTPPAQAAGKVQETRRTEQVIGKGASDALTEARRAWAIEKDYRFRGLERLKQTITIGLETAFSFSRPMAERVASNLIEGKKTLLDKLVNLEPIKESELTNLGTLPSSITKFGYERGDKKVYTYEGKLKPPQPTPAAAPAPAVKPGEGETMAGPGGTIPSDIGVSTSELTQLAQSAPKVAGKATPGLAASAKELLRGAAASARTFLKNTKEYLYGEPKWDTYLKALGQWQALRQESARDAYVAWKNFKRQIPSTERRGAIAAWVDAGGDKAVMEKAAAELPKKYADIYKQALALSPDEVVFAKNIRSYFDKRLQDAQDAGLLENGLENYIRRIYEKEPELADAYSAELQRLSTATPDFAKKRFYQYDADAIKAGKKPVMDFAARVLEYDQALNHAIADRAFVKAMMGQKMPDGRPRIDVGGSGKLLPEGEVPKEAVLIKPQFKPNSDLPIDNRSDYRPFNHPAFRKYKWVTKDTNGKDVFVQGDVLVHPDALRKMQTLLETSKIRQHPIGRGALKVSSTIKQTMLDLSLFHPVQIGVHGIEHRVNPLTLKEINLKDPTQKALVEHGLIVAEDRGFYDWSEGLHGTSLTRHIPGIGPKLQDFHDWMFKEWIPTIKMNMAEHALERNRARYPKLNEDQLLKITAEQANAAFGGLNYRMLGRSQTMQDFLRLTLLAPDFLEARGRFTGQALKGYGKEQATALLLGAATLYITARMANQMISGNPHWEKENAFSVIYKDHAYGLRTVQGDILHLLSKPGQFWYHRLNPTITRPLMEAISGRDYFGRQVGIGDVLLDEIKSVIPISLRGLAEGKEQNLLESALNAMGVTTRRYNAITQAYELAKDWRDKTKTRPEPGEFIYDPDKDPLRGLKLALQHENTADAVKEISDLIKRGGYTARELQEHFDRYASSPIAGSAKNQKKFLDSLRPDQQEIVRLAQDRKKKTNADFRAALRLYQKR